MRPACQNVPTPAGRSLRRHRTGPPLFQLERAGIELVILSVLGDQLGMVAALNDVAQARAP